MRTRDDGDSVVWWLRTLAVACVFAQRLAVPGTPVPLLVPIALCWVAYGLAIGRLRLDRARTQNFLIFVAASSGLIVVQNLAVPQPLISILSLGLVIATWGPFVATIADGDRASHFGTALRIWTNTTVVLAALTIAMTATQLLGVAYTDVVGGLVPQPFLMPGYITTYPLHFGSEVYRSNGWIGLEASIVSFDLGLGVLCALVGGQRSWKVLVLLAAMLCTYAGSGFLILLVGVPILLVLGHWSSLRPYLIGALPVGAVLLLTPYGQGILERGTETSSSTSSTSLRTVQAYVELAPRWLNEPVAFLIGRGPGSSQQIVAGLGQDGLQSSTLAKILFEYGVLAGGAFLVFMISCYRRSPSAAISGAILVSLFTVQPGVTVMALVAPLYLLVGLWKRSAEALEEPPLESVVPARSEFGSLMR